MYKIILLCLVATSMILRVSGQYDGSEETFEEPEEQTTVATTPTTRVTTPRGNTSTPSPEHVIGQVNNVLGNVENFNISGIVDQALGIRNNVPVRNLVNGIINTVFCNSWLNNFNNCKRQKSPSPSATAPVSED